ncbi:MAG: VOC family protein [Phycisphaerales bacterium]|nr:VOC family protein [Phycisphaerales bacterium]
MSSTMMPSGLSELVLIVADVPRSAAFYADIVGLIPERPGDEAWAWFWSGTPHASARIALSRGPLLFEDHSPRPEDARFGAVHYAFHIARDDLDAMLDRLRRHDIDIHGPTWFEWMNADSWYFYDPDGNLLEYWVPRPT